MEYRDEVNRLTEWCSVNNLQLNTTKTKERIFDFRKGRVDPAPLYIHGNCVERVHSMRFLGVQISDDLSWTANTMAVVKKAQLHLHFLRVLRTNNLEERLLVTFYRATIESILTYSITTWYAGCSAADRKVLQRVINTAQKITGCSLPSLEVIANSRYLSRAGNIIKDQSHPSNRV
uniref:Alkylated DNA repair protein AlkB homologue 8 N-terminal domain-containing protein n=1 Tax=Nothobranchius korthausae TaxID=1143690 RepID=A0A1A8FSH0_9TELE